MMIAMFMSLWHPVASEGPYFSQHKQEALGQVFLDGKLSYAHMPPLCIPHAAPFQFPEILSGRAIFMSWPRNLRTTWTLSSICSLPLVCHQILSLLDWSHPLSCHGSSFCLLWACSRTPFGHIHLPSEIPSTASIQTNVPKLLASRHFLAEYFGYGSQLFTR